MLKNEAVQEMRLSKKGSVTDGYHLSPTPLTFNSKMLELL